MWQNAHHNLEPVKAPGFGDLNFATEALDEVLIDDAVRGSKESEDVGDEMTFVVIELVFPVVEVLREVHLLCSPEGCFGLFVHLPDLHRTVSE